MGYTSVYVGNTTESSKTLMTRELEQYGSIKVLKSAMVRGVYYAAYVMNKRPEEVHGIVCLVRKSKGEFIYKDIDEEMGPFESRCPKSILDLLTPTESTYANEWRERCRAYAKNSPEAVRKQLMKLPIGTYIKANDEHICVKVEASHGKKRPFFMLVSKFAYLPITRINKFSVIETAA